MTCCQTIAKGLLIIINISFMICGIILLITASWGLINITNFMDLFTNTTVMQEKLEDDLSRTTEIFLYVLLAISLVMILISTFGCFGAVCNKPCLLACYLFFVAVVLLIEIVVGVLLITYQKETNDVIKEWLTSCIKHEYGSPPNAVTFVWDGVFSYLQCCGIGGPDDFLDSAFANSSDKIYPLACCNVNSDSIMQLCLEGSKDKVNYFQTGCLNKMLELIDTQKHFVGGIVLVTGVLEVLIIIAGINLIRVTAPKEDI